MRGYSRIVVACFVALGAAACSDSATSPSAPTRQLSPSNRPSLTLAPGVMFGGARTTTFTVTSNGGSFNIGGLYTVNFPANSVCDPSVSSYGPGTWDDSCTTLGAGQSVTITATYGFTFGGPVVDFAPALRFNPNTNVTISTGLYAPLLTAFKSYWLANPSALHWLGIYYTPNFGHTTVTDGAFDSSLVTHVNLTTGQIWRRVKHFSGYSVSTGEPCTPSPDNPDCVDDGGPQIQQ